MLRSLNNNRAQAVAGEYVLVLFLVLAVISGMTIYFKRGVQARIHDARDYMVGEVRTRTLGQFDGNLYKEYEPYYGNSTATVTASSDDTARLLPTMRSGIFVKNIDHKITISSNSQTAPPRDFDSTTPRN